MFKQLKNCNLFFGLEEADIENIMSSINYQIRKYRKDDIIALSGDTIINQLLIVEGSAKGEMIDFTGKTIKIEDIESPRPLAPAFLFGNSNRYPVNIVANNSVLIISIHKTEFIKLLTISEKVLSNYLNIISNRAQFLSGKLKFLSFHSIKGKLAHYILAISTRTTSAAIHLDVTQSELAELFGVARPSLARAIRDLDRDGIIKARGRDIEILCPDRLSALLK
jgi:CRP-like cAMP-binding protein